MFQDRDIMYPGSSGWFVGRLIGTKPLLLRLVPLVLFLL